MIAVLAVLLLLVSPARAEPVEGDAVVRLSELGNAGLTRIDGCFDLLGRAVDHMGLGVFGTRTQDVDLRGRLRDGHWVTLETKPHGTDDPWSVAVVHQPMFGIFPNQSTPAFLTSLLRKITASVSAEWATGQSDRLLLYKTLAGSAKSDNTMTTYFDREPLRARRWELRVSSPIRGIQDGGHRVRIDRMNIDLTLGPDGAPLSESIDGQFAQGIFTVQMRSQLDWVATPCAVEPVR